MADLKDKKILFVVTKSNWGGAQRYVYDPATALPKAAFAVSVAFGQPGWLADELKKAGIATHPIPSLQRDVSLTADVKCFFELFHLFRAIKPDIVHLNSSKAGGIGALAARLAGVPRIIFTSHGLAWDENRNIFAKAALWLTSQITFLLCHRVITISIHHHRRVPGSVMIYNGIQPMTFSTGEIIRRAFPPNASITGTVGELTNNKNQQALIEQAKDNPDMYVAIVGEGENRALLEQKIKRYGLENRVKLFGFIPASDVLRGFDVFALPSLKEGLPYVLLEAKAAGVPITANRVGGVGEILDAKDMSEFSLEHMVRETRALYSA